MEKNNQIIISKEDAADELRDFQEITYELFDWILQNDPENKLGSKREKMEKLRNKLGVIKHKKIVII